MSWTPITPSKPELRAQEYRARAQGAVDAAHAAKLDRAREQHEAAAAKWLELAEAEESRARTSRARLALAAAAAAAD